MIFHHGRGGAKGWYCAGSCDAKHGHRRKCGLQELESCILFIQEIGWQAHQELSFIGHDKVKDLKTSEDQGENPERFHWDSAQATTGLLQRYLRSVRWGHRNLAGVAGGDTFGRWLFSSDLSATSGTASFHCTSSNHGLDAQFLGKVSLRWAYFVVFLLHLVSLTWYVD